MDVNVVTYDAYIDQVDIVEEDYLNNSDDAMKMSNDNAGIFSITNDYSSEGDDTLADKHKEEWTSSAFRTRRPEKNVFSAEGFMLAREAVLRFVQDSIAHAVDLQQTCYASERIL